MRQRIGTMAMPISRHSTREELPSRESLRRICSVRQKKFVSTSVVLNWSDGSSRGSTLSTTPTLEPSSISISTVNQTPACTYLNQHGYPIRWVQESYGVLQKHGLRPLYRRSLTNGQPHNLATTTRCKVQTTHRLNSRRFNNSQCIHQYHLPPPKCFRNRMEPSIPCRANKLGIRATGTMATLLSMTATSRPTRLPVRNTEFARL